MDKQTIITKAALKKVARMIQDILDDRNEFQVDGCKTESDEKQKQIDAHIRRNVSRFAMHLRTLFFVRADATSLKSLRGQHYRSLQS